MEIYPPFSFYKIRLIYPIQQILCQTKVLRNDVYICFFQGRNAFIKTCIDECRVGFFWGKLLMNEKKFVNLQVKCKANPWRLFAKLQCNKRL